MSDLAQNIFEIENRSPSGNKSRKRRERNVVKNERLRARHPLQLEPKTEKQSDYLGALRTQDQVFATGGAGTGKTYIPSRFSITELLAGNCEQIIISRPTVCRPEHKLGFLPGSAKQKMEPWLIPIIAAMKEQVNKIKVDEWLKTDVIEFVPFEHMRGRTFKNAFVILDEAQNCTLQDLRLFLTRIGEDTKVVVTGDTDQIDIPNSGLATVIKMIEDHEISASVIKFGPQDVVRSKIAREWVTAFSKSA
jgi:phosphate starvation-inducible PhoH-like protein